MNQTIDQTIGTIDIETAPTPTAARYAVLHGEWHGDIVANAVRGFCEDMERFGPGRAAVDLYPVAGAFETPLMARRLARAGRHAAIVACAFVVDGGVYRHDFVAATVVEALMRVQLDTDVPVLSVILTPHQFRAEPPLADLYAGHFRAKGAEAARACRETVRRLAAI